LTSVETIAPSAIVIALWVVIWAVFPQRQAWSGYFVLAMFAGILAIYLPWRLHETLLPVSPLTGAGLYVWFVFAVEIVFLLDFLKLALIHCRVADRSREADEYQSRLEAMPSDAWPTVDVLIPTYNEPIDVLERSIIGCMALDYPRFKVWVLDDGRREWLRDYCAEKGVRYLTRSNSQHAKAGNINSGLAQTDGELVAIFDADFVPKKEFLRRCVGFFLDPRIGIVQTPQHFFNRDPVQKNLWLSNKWPDEQRLFFDKIAPSVDAWDAMFCCGSCSVSRRKAIDEIGGIPTQSITEDILTTLSMYRKGYITRYLNERLSIGLAPESLEAFYVQRARWCQGGIQTLFVENGVLGPGIPLIQRVLVFPIYWLFHLPAKLLLLVIPILFFWFGLEPVHGARSQDILFWQLPLLINAWLAATWFHGRQGMPLLSEAPSILIAFRLLPVVLLTLVKPFGHPFRVTPKGSAAGKTTIATRDLSFVLAMLGLTLGGILINVPSDFRIIADDRLLGVAHVWAVANIFALIVAALMCVEYSVVRGQERFLVLLDATACVDGKEFPVRVQDLSLSGARVVMPRAIRLSAGQKIVLRLKDVGDLEASVVRRKRSRLGVRFDRVDDGLRDRLIVALYTGEFDSGPRARSVWAVIAAVAFRFWGRSDERETT
jgi:cellulose synthase (UDP-forming)